MIHQRTRVIAAVTCGLFMSTASTYPMLNKMSVNFNFTKEDKRDLFDASLCFAPLIAAGIIKGVHSIRSAYAKANAAYDPCNYELQNKVHALQKEKKVVDGMLLGSLLIAEIGLLAAHCSIARRDFANSLQDTVTSAAASVTNNTQASQPVTPSVPATA